ncbi:MAG: tRNA pseudouridine(38-40) synthase TruA [Alphaproteobacteria bacterium]|nr:tRNA pseudouridine(38-40) synthase TruA [Alphaproteobacteria bacterium]
MTRYKLILEYDGTDLIGWQANAQGPSVQSLLSDAIFQFCGERADIVAAGRTDAGVHALAMALHFDLEKDVEPDTVMAALNFYLNGGPVSVLFAERADENFHARFDCKKRRYKYIILNRRAPAVLDKNRVWWVPRLLDADAMRTAATKLVGNHDFTSFRAAECQSKSPVKTLDDVQIKTAGDEIILEFSAKSFLHHQVRNMVGTLVEIGLRKPYDIDEIFAKKNRAAAGPTAPPSGLYFVSAEY